MSDVTKLGVLLDADAQRDAVHIAVAPVVAADMLHPGDHVGLLLDGRAGRGPMTAFVGIVDPFLTTRVMPGDRFWLFLYPGTITSLRHQWTHPAFDVQPPAFDVQPPAFDVQPPLQAVSAKEASEKWLREFIRTADCPSYEEVVSVALGNHDVHRQWCEEYLHFNGIDAHGDIPPEFWDHLEVVSGMKIPQEKRARAFSCGC